jgi:hypothetical protein
MDTLSVDLVVTDDQADVVLDRAQAKIQNFASKVEGLNPSLGRRMAVDFELAERRADSVQKKFASIANTRIDTGQFDALTRTAIRAENRASSLRSELESIRKTAASTTNSSILAQLEVQAKGLQSELVKVEALQSRIAPAVAGGGGGSGHGSFIQPSGAIRGAGPLFRAAGLYQYGIDESIINAVLIGAPKAAAAIGTTIASLGAVVGIGAAAIAITYKVTGDIRTEAERRLKVEELIAGAMNKQILAGQEIIKNFDKQLGEDAGDRQFDRFLKSASNDELQHRFDLLKKLHDLDPTGENAAKFETQGRRIAAQRDANNNGSAATADKAFDDRWEKWKKDQQDAKKKQEDAAKAFEKSVEQAKTKINDLSKTWTSAFDSLYQRTAGDNPFAVFLAKSQTDTDKLKLALAGLPPELQKIAFGMHAIADAKEAFSLRLDNALSVANLRFEAGNFSDPTQQEMQRRLNADIANFRRTSNSTNPEAIAEFQRRQNAITNYNKDRQTDFLNSEYNTIYDTRRPGYDPSAADRRFVELTRGFNPDDLPDNLRRAASDARLNEAARQEKFEQDAQDERKKQTELQSKLLETQTRLLALAEKEGTAGINKLLVEVRDAPTTKSTVTSPTPADVEYNTFSGPGGLTDF